MSVHDRQENRRTARALSNASSKPYSKRFNGKVSPAPAPADAMAPMPLMSVVAPNTSTPASRAGFPSYAQYKELENNYLDALSVRKREKALITQASFDRIWDLLHDPNARIGTSQFRFWVRKMFTLSDAADSGAATKSVILHDGRPVAIVEQLYDLLCYCHARADHAGRDRTAKIVRKHYSWVPKELIAQFVKSCPTCTASRNCGGELAPRKRGTKSAKKSVKGSPARDMDESYDDDDDYCDDSRDSRDSTDLSSASVYQDTTGPNDHGFEPFPQSRSSISISDLINSENFMLPPEKIPAAKDMNWPPTNGPMDNSLRPSLAPRTNSALSFETTATTGSPAPAVNNSPRKFQSHGMSREVSMLNGIPNGWGYFFDHPEAAPAHPYVANLSEAEAAKRPRIPSVALKRRPGLVDTDGNSENLPPLMKALQDGIIGRTDYMADRPDDGTGADGLPPSLQPFRMFRGRAPADQDQDMRSPGPYIPQIDPALLAEEAHMARALPAPVPETLHSNIIPDWANAPLPPPRDDEVDEDVSSGSIRVTAPTPPPKLHRPGAPSYLDLGPIDFTSYRSEDMSAGGLSTYAEPSSTPSSVGSCYSQMSAFPMAVTSSGESDAPLQTPSAELTKDMAGATLDGEPSAFDTFRRGLANKTGYSRLVDSEDILMTCSPGPDAWNDI